MLIFIQSYKVPFLYIVYNYGGFSVVPSHVLSVLYFVNDITNISVCLTGGCLQAHIGLGTPGTCRNERVLTHSVR